jgi:uncharacterized protein involved in exopolysaccharide biosynthesis
MNTQPSETHKEIHVLDSLDVLLRHRWMIVRNVLITVGIVILVTLFLPKQYTAVATLMPPQERENPLMQRMLSDMPVPGFSVKGSTSTNDLLTEMLKSRSVQERVLRRSFVADGDSVQLYRLLGAFSVERGLLRLGERVRFPLSEQGILSVTVEWPDSQLAADIANAFVEELDTVNQQKSVSRAKNSRVYLESQLEETEDKLRQATKRLAAFQQKHKTVSLEDQTKASIDQAGELKGQILAREIQLGVLRQTMKPENPLVVQARRKLEQLRKRYREMQYGEQIAAGDTGDVFLAITDVPAIGVQLAVLMREVSVQETVWTLLNQQYYQAKIEEARNTPTVQVLDPAMPPLVPTSPDKKMLVTIFALLSLVLSVLWAFGLEYRSRLDERPGEKARWNRIASYFSNDMRIMRDRLASLKQRFFRHH